VASVDGVGASVERDATKKNSTRTDHRELTALIRRVLLLPRFLCTSARPRGHPIVWFQGDIHVYNSHRQPASINASSSSPMKSLYIAHLNPILTRSTVDLIKPLVNLVIIDLYNPRPYQIEIFLCTRKVH
jgi:hypothetical protein